MKLIRWIYYGVPIGCASIMLLPAVLPWAIACNPRRWASETVATYKRIWAADAD